MDVHSKKIKITSKSSLSIHSATAVGLGMWYSKQLIPRATGKLIEDDMKAMKKLRNRRLKITRIPSIYLSNLAQATLGKIKENA